MSGDHPDHISVPLANIYCMYLIFIMQWSKFESHLLHEFNILADLRQCHKTFFFVADAGTKQASVFVSGKFFRAYFRYKFNTNIQN